MQKRVLLLAIPCVLFFIGLTVYLAIAKRNFTENPSQLPSGEQPSNDVSAGGETQTRGETSQIGITMPKKIPDDYGQPMMNIKIATAMTKNSTLKTTKRAQHKNLLPERSKGSTL
jgi:hypothetical protein